MKGKWTNFCFILIILSIIMCEDTKADSKDKSPITEKEPTNTNVKEFPEMTKEVAEGQYSSTEKREPENPTKKGEEKKEEVK